MCLVINTEVFPITALIFANAWLVLLLAAQLMSIYSAFKEKGKGAVLKERPKIAVLIAVWNEALHIEHCIDSLLKQDYPRNKYKIVVVGGGTDNTMKICKKLEKEGKIKYLPEKERKGKWVALNNGINWIKHNVRDCYAVALLDGDYVIEPDWLNDLVANSFKHDIVINRIKSASTKTLVGTMAVIYYTLYNYFIPVFSKIFGACAWMGQSSLIKMHVFDKVMFENSLVEDMRFGVTARMKGFSIAFSNSLACHAIPKDVNSFRKELMRALNGIYAELLPRLELFPLFLFILPLLIIVGFPLWVYEIISFELSTVIISVLLLLVTIIDLKSCKLRVTDFPILVFLVLACLAIYIETIARMLTNKNIGWPLIDKVRD